MERACLCLVLCTLDGVCDNVSLLLLSIYRAGGARE